MFLLSDWHDEGFAVIGSVDGGDGPGDADAQEDVDGITSRHVADRRVGVLILSGRHFAGEHVWWPTQQQETAKSTAAAAKENVARPATESEKDMEKQLHNHVSSRPAACVYINYLYI